jgi:hypothetical protein
VPEGLGGETGLGMDALSDEEEDDEEEEAVEPGKEGKRFI